MMVGLREPFNAISHMVGVAIAMAAIPILVILSRGSLAVVSATVYGSALLSVFAVSALYHSMRHQRTSDWLFQMDQATIYLLIAGTYTPIVLLRVGGALGWWLFGIEWVIALTGIVLLFKQRKTPPWVHQAAYITLGWAALAAFPQLKAMPWQAFALILGGGVAYTGGATIYWRDRKGTWDIGDHGIWHLFVLVGAVAHLAFVMMYVL